MKLWPSLPSTLVAGLLAAASGCMPTGEPVADTSEPGGATSAAAAPAQTEPARQTPAAAEDGGPLAGTEWQLAELQSMDDSIGTTRPDDPSLYTMSLNADGTASLRLNCNRGTANWSAGPGASPDSGTFTFGPMAMTRALCPPGSLDERLAREAQYVRTYLLRDGRLSLSLMADGGIQIWEPMTD